MDSEAKPEVVVEKWSFRFWKIYLFVNGETIYYHRRKRGPNSSISFYVQKPAAIRKAKSIASALGLKVRIEP